MVNSHIFFKEKTLAIVLFRFIFAITSVIYIIMLTLWLSWNIPGKLDRNKSAKRSSQFFYIFIHTPNSDCLYSDFFFLSLFVLILKTYLSYLIPIPLLQLRPKQTLTILLNSPPLCNPSDPLPLPSNFSPQIFCSLK